MCPQTVEIARYRPAGYDPAVAIGERKPLHVEGAKDFAEAKQMAEKLLDAEPPVVIGGQVYKPSVIVPPWRQ